MANPNFIKNARLSDPVRKEIAANYAADAMHWSISKVKRKLNVELHALAFKIVNGYLKTNCEELEQNQLLNALSAPNAPYVFNTFTAVQMPSGFFELDDGLPIPSALTSMYNEMAHFCDLFASTESYVSIDNQIKEYYELKAQQQAIETRVYTVLKNYTNPAEACESFEDLLSYIPSDLFAPVTTDERIRMIELMPDFGENYEHLVFGES